MNHFISRPCPVSTTARLPCTARRTWQQLCRRVASRLQSRRDRKRRTSSWLPVTTNHRSVFRSRDMGCSIRGQYYFLSSYQVHITADNNQDVLDRGKFIPVAVTSNPVANNGVSSAKQKVGGKMKKKLNKNRHFKQKVAQDTFLCKIAHDFSRP